MNQKEMKEVIEEYRKFVSYLPEEGLIREVAINLHSIFLQLKELEEALPEK